jgi:Tfp pilus assembly protein PilO
MKKYFAQLRPLERRLAVGVLVVVILVLNGWLIWPHFSDWGNLRRRLNNAQSKLKLYQTNITQLPLYEAQMKKFESQGESVAPEDQAVNFIRTIQTQAAESGVGIGSTSRQLTHTNEFFVEQVQNISVTATDEQLVDFLYKLGSGVSMIRVRDLELQPDTPHQHLNANIRLVASYQKKPTAAKPAAAPAAAKPLTKTAK